MRNPADPDSQPLSHDMAETAMANEESSTDDSADKVNTPDPHKKPRRHIIRITWLRRTLKSLMWLLLGVLMLPVLIYIPPVQTLLKNVACSYVARSTGMKIDIDRFRLRFPLDVSLDGLSVVEASGDTMVRARTAEIDIKMLPLMSLDIQVKKLRLIDGYYRMVSSDSSMTLKVHAPFFEASPGTSADIAESLISLDEVTLRGGRIDLYMDVWKSKPTPPTPGVFVIKAGKLHLQDFTFTMSMLPTIDSLGIKAATLELEGGLVDLRRNLIDIRKALISDGAATYMVPTADYIKSHPAPPPSPYPSAPMVIKASEIALQKFDALYATRGARPQPGFDPAYIQFSGLALSMRDFYNEQSTLRLPVAGLEGRERSGLVLTSGTGTVEIDSLGIALRKMHISTLASDIKADAYISMGSMALQPEAPFSIDGKMSIGLSDINSFMPAISAMLRPLRRFGPLQADINASGTLSAIAVPKLDLRLPGFLTLQAKGRVANAMDFKRLDAALEFYGNMLAPQPLQSMLQFRTFALPPFTIRGKATAKGQDYSAAFSLTSPAGEVKADGRVGLDSERYYADVNLHDLDASLFAPDAGVGRMTGHLLAEGAGFNPTRHGADANIDIDIEKVVYNHYPLTAIKATASLHGGRYTLDLASRNDAIDGIVTGSGHISDGTYDIDLTADIANLDMKRLGLTPDTCYAHGVFSLNGYIDPATMLCDLRLSGNDLYYRQGAAEYELPGAVEAGLLSQRDAVWARIDAQGLSADFSSPNALKRLLPQMQKAMTVITHQIITDRRLDMEAIQYVLPDFDMGLRASGSGILAELLKPSGMTVDSIQAVVNNHELLTASALALGISNSSMRLDTVTARMNERGQLLDYAFHLGNAPGTMDEYADVNLTGYVGQKRLSAFLRHKNLKGETGYRLGLTAYFTDTLVNVHFTPLKAIIAYIPWTFNDDNYVSCDMKDRIEANLSAQSRESKISVQTIERPGKLLPKLSVMLDNIHLNDFTPMIIGAPDISGTLTTNLELEYENKAFTGNGSLSLKDFTYEGRRVADFTGEFQAGLDLNGNTSAHATLDIDGHRALSFSGTLAHTDQGLQPTDMTLDMAEFPVSVANAFLPADMAQVSGNLSGSMSMTGSMARPVLNGSMSCRDVKVMIPMMAATLSFDSVPLTVVDSKIDFNDFDIYGVKNSLSLNGSVDASDIADILLDLNLSGRNFMLINNDKRARSQIYGKILVNADATVKGSLSLLDVNGTLSVLNGTDATYTLSEMQQSGRPDNSDVVKFVQFSDSTLITQADSVVRSSSMRINAALNISNGVKMTVNLNSNGSNHVQLSPYGSLSFFQNYMGDMRLNGQLNLGNGMVRYAVPAIGEKKFTISPESYVVFNGDIMNPTLHLMASDIMRSVANTGGNSSRVLNFLVSVSATGTLSHPNVLFDLSTDDDISIENELESMSADQRSSEAINMILYGRYMGPGASGTSGGAQGFATNALYGFLESQINNWAANNIRGIELSFGIDQYNTMQNGREGTSTSYSYQVSKSLFNNKFKIVVGGNYSTDQNSDQDIAENLISNISFEYMLRQTNSTSMYVKLFRHSDYESILEGEITEMGVGFVMQRKLSDLRQLFKWLRRKRRQHVRQGSPDPPTPTTIRMNKEKKDSGTAVPNDTLSNER